MSTLPSLKVILSITTSSHRLLTSVVVVIKRIMLREQRVDMKQTIYVLLSSYLPSYVHLAMSQFVFWRREEDRRIHSPTLVESNPQFLHSCHCVSVDFFFFYFVSSLSRTTSHSNSSSSKPQNCCITSLLMGSTRTCRSYTLL